MVAGQGDFRVANAIDHNACHNDAGVGRIQSHGPCRGASGKGGRYFSAGAESRIEVAISQLVGFIQVADQGKLPAARRADRENLAVIGRYRGALVEPLIALETRNLLVHRPSVASPAVGRAGVAAIHARGDNGNGVEGLAAGVFVIDPRAVGKRTRGDAFRALPSPQ